MALRKRAPLAILAGEPNRIAFVQQRSEGQGFGGRPIDPFACLDRVTTIVEEALDRLVHIEARRRYGDARSQLLELADGNAGDAAPIVVDRILPGLEAGPAPVEPIGLVGLIALARLVFGLQTMAPVAPHLVDLALGDQPFADQLAGVDLEGGRMRPYDAVHQRLGESRLVALVVAVAAITEHVDDDRLVKPLPELDGDLGAIDHGLRVIAIDVEDRRFDE